MVEQRASLRSLLELRRQFGRGSAGKRAFRVIASGVLCEALLDGQGSVCDQRADRTVDFDVLGSFDFVPSCGAAHEELIGARILADLERQGRITVLGRNGWGRA